MFQIAGKHDLPVNWVGSEVGYLDFGINTWRILIEENARDEDHVLVSSRFQTVHNHIIGMY